MIRLKIFGGDHLGLYVKATNKYFLYHSLIPQHRINILKEALKVEAIPVDLTNSLIMSPFIACNSFGIIIPELIDSNVIEYLTRVSNDVGIHLSKIGFKYNSFGNLILANDRGAIISPILPTYLRKIIADTLDVEVVASTIGRFSYVGSLGISNNKGALISPYIKSDEKELIEDILKVKVYTGTINNGVEFISSGIIVNDYGLVVGPSTTGSELMLLSQAFKVD